MRQIVMTPSVGAPRPRRSMGNFGQKFGPVCPNPDSAAAGRARMRAQIPPAFRGAPVHLSAEALSVVSGATASVNTLALKDPRPLEIHAIKFGILGGIDPATATPIAVNGGMVAVNLTLGALPITQGYVPIWCFGRGETLADDGCVGDGGDFTGDNFPYRAEYVWRLPRPLYVPPGRIVTPQIQHRGIIPNTIDFRISYVGRTVEERKRGTKIEVPYVTSWLSSSYATDTGRTIETSSETDFRNPFGVPMHVNYFVGRTFQTGTISGTNGLVCAGSPYNLYNTLFRFKMAHSSGLRVIEDYTPIGAIIPVDQGAIWPCPHELDPGSYFNFELLFTGDGWWGSTPFSPYATYLEQVHLAMVGWREEVL